MSKISVLGLSFAALGAWSAFAGVGVYDATTQTLTYDVAQGVTSSETVAFSSYGTVARVVKTGAGVLKIAGGDNSAYAGLIDISNGVFDVATSTAFCTSAATVYVRSTETGAGQFRISFESGGQNKTHVYCVIHLAGVGPDGSGAFYAANTKMGDSIFSKSMQLDADAKVGGSSRVGYSAVLNGHTLTDAISGEHVIRGFNPGSGHVIYTGGGKFVVSGDFGGSAANTLTIAKAGSSVCYWDSGVAPVWTLKFDESGNIASGAGSDSGKNRWAGPIEIAKDKVLTFCSYNSESGHSVGASGAISGEGRVVCGSDQAKMSAYLTGENTYTGGTTVKNGCVLYANADKSIPETGSIEVKTGSLQFNAVKWNAAELKKRLSNVVQGNGFVNYYTPAGTSATDGGEGFAATANQVRIGHGGGGAFTSTGPITGRPTLTADGGTWTIRSKTVGAENNFYVSSGTMLFEATGDLWTSNRTSYVYGSATSLAKLVVSNSVVGGKETTSGTNFGGITKVGISEGNRAVLHVTGERAAYTNYLWLGNAAKSAGSVWQDGGSVFASCNSTADGRWGDSGYGAYDLAGGKLRIGHCENIGFGLSGVGILRMTGGTATCSDLFVGSGGTGVVHVADGTLSATKITLGQRQWAREGGIGQSELTVAGGLVSVSEFQLGQRPAPAQSLLNLNGGVLKCSTALWRVPNIGTEIFFTAANQPSAWVNCNGGTLRMSASAQAFSTGSLNRPTKVTLYERGLTVDMGNGDVTVGVPLEAPTGLGIKAIALPANFPATGWIGAQHVVIRGGSGYGAAAITDFDPKTMSISKIIVTSPGQGYRADDVVTASLPNVANTAPLACGAVTLGELVSGGLTVTNSGAASVCRLTAANTYTGATTVAAGTLQIAVKDAIAASKAVRVAAGAKLDLAGKQDLSVETFGGAGTVQGGDVTVTRELVFDAAELAAGKAMAVTGLLSLGAGVTMRVTGGTAAFPRRSRTILTATDGISGAVTGLVDMGEAAGGYDWTARVVGHSLRLVCGKGMVVLLL